DSVSAAFKIDSSEFDFELNLWKVKMRTTDDGSKDVREYLEFQKKKMEEISPIIFFGNLLCQELGQVEKAEKYFNMLLKTLPKDHEEIDSVYTGIGNVMQEKGELNLALDNYQLGYEIRQKRFAPDHLRIASSLNTIGNIYRRKGNYNKAISYLEKSLDIFAKRYSDGHLRKAYCLTNIGLAFQAKKDNNAALKYLIRACEMYKEVLPSQHPDIALSFGELAGLYEDQEDYANALKYYHLQYEMDEKCLPSDHPDLSKHFGDLADAYKKKGDIEQCSEFCRTQLVKQKNLFGDNHPRVARTLMRMGDLTEACNTSMRYYEQALNILENCNHPNQSNVIECLEKISGLCHVCSLFDEAIVYRLAALEIQQKLLSSDHTKIAHSFLWVGYIYFEQKNYSDALINLDKSLHIYQSNYSSEHDTIKEVKKLIDEVNQALNPLAVQDEEPLPPTTTQILTTDSELDVT
ncbi:unnamed protein product, partial [Didymodactylos carnosus]